MGKWNPWKVTALAMALVMATALVAGLVVANWSGPSREDAQSASPPSSGLLVQQPRSGARPPAQAVQPIPSAPMVPTKEVVDACNRSAAARVESNKTTEVVKEAPIGAVVGAAGAAGGASAGGGKEAGKSAAIGGVVGAGGGTLYGLNENRRNDERYRDAYSSCLRSRGYTG